MATETQPQGNVFVRTIEGVIAGQIDNARLAQVIESSRASITEHEEAFHGTVDHLTPEVREICQPLIESADELLASLHRSCDLAAQYIESGDQQLLYDAGQLAHAGSVQLNILFFELRNTALRAQGPTDIPNLNLLLQAWEHCKADLKSDKDQVLRGLVEAERLASIGQLRDIEQAPKTEEIELLGKAWDTHLRCMNRLAIGYDAGKLADVAKEIENCKTTFERIKEVMPAAMMSQRTVGPTPDPQANLVISLAKDVENLRIHESVLVEALNDLYKALVGMREEFEKAATTASDSVLVQEEIDRAREAIELQDTALREFAEFMQNREVLVMHSAVAKLERSAIALYECYEQFQSIADREGKTVCVRCSHYNPSNRKNCEKCGAGLPVMATSGPASSIDAREGEPAQAGLPQGPVLTENMVRIYTAVNKVHEGEITKEQFLKEVEWFESVLEKNSGWEQEEPDLEEVTDEERPQAEAVLKALDEAEEVFRQGWQELQSACEHWRSYVESEIKAELEEGVRQADAGSRKIAMVRAAVKPGAQQAETADAGSEIPMG